MSYYTGGTALVLDSAARVSLRPTSSSDVGLLLTRGEYDDVLAKFHKKISLDEQLRSAVYHWTAGHVVAVTSVLHFLTDKVRGLPLTVSND